VRFIPEESIFCAALQLSSAAFAKQSEPQNNRGCQKKKNVATKRRKVMKKHIATLFGFALLLAAASAHAQITETVQVKVPFPFVAAGRTMPAADYRVKITEDTGLITLSTPGRSAILLTIRNEHPGKESGNSSLKFERYGDSWVLEEVTYDGTEQVLRRGKVEQKLAQLQPSGEQTLMASNITPH